MTALSGSAVHRSGAHHRTLEFNAAATDPESLDYLLREQLAGY